MKKLLLLVFAALLIAPAAVPSAAQAATYETKVTWGVNLRSAPSATASIYRMLSKGENIHVISPYNAYWYKVQTKSGQIGYISTDPKYTNYKGGGGSAGDAVSSSKADLIISTAKSLIGRVKYQFGVRNPSRLIFDCSSFTEYVFEKHGVQLKWGTRYQQNAGSAVSKSNLRKGDLVFFNTSGSGINHVGIYIGSGQFIHNSPSSNVGINNLNTGYWKSKYVKARRVL